MTRPSRMTDQKADPPRQLPLDLGHGTGYSRDDLVVSGTNAAGGGAGRPLAGLALAGGRAGRSGRLRQNASGLDLARARRRGERSTPGASATASTDLGARPALIDDVDAGPVDEEGLFHLINAVRGAGSQLLLTARRFPAAWGVALPDLASRLKAAATVEIHEPDDLLLAGVITKLFADRQVEVEPHVVQYLVRRIERSLATAMRVVDRLDRTALERKTPITRALAAETVSAMDEGQGEFEI